MVLILRDATMTWSMYEAEIIILILFVIQGGFDPKGCNNDTGAKKQKLKFYHNLSFRVVQILRNATMTQGSCIK